MTENNGSLWRRRFVRYWLKNAEIQVLTALGLFVFYFVWQIIAIGQMTWQESLAGITYLAKFFGAFFVGILQMTSNKNLFSMALAFGSTRREAFLGHQLALLVEIVQLVLVNMVIDIAAVQVNDELSVNYAEKFLVTAAALILAAGIGQLGAVVISHFGNVALGIISSLCGVATAVVFGVGFAFAEEPSFFTADWNLMIWCLFEAGIVLYAVGMVTEKRHLQKIVVQM